MRKITPSQIAVFSALSGLAVCLAVAAAALTVGRLPLGDLRGVALALAWLVFLYAFAIALYRLFLAGFPLLPGEIAPGSRQEFIYHVYILFYLMLFYPVMRSGFVPAPFMRLFYLALGTRLGENTYSQGILHDPPFVTIGAHSVVGQYAILIPHVIEGSKLAHYPIRIGDHVTVGAHASVLSDVEIGNGAIIATGAVVPKGTRIGPGEVWGGVPARRLGTAGARAGQE
ncbi:MAG TPA: transferase [Rhodocyclaceae bacterium]|nr:MAG: transferase [Betaproteobacteria bacterium CG2_30_68_42]PIX75480.1 MAG: transferase [Rhodocyclales bacterium CG_4_10_14_3_um_filter_68_10]PJA58080.1 MAG: transferase [Rhodocyclales bacterium CG_4_9_14_3_um_filter_68_10]HCX33728.1 transferase [Rhodocyclaceae bacterium]